MYYCYLIGNNSQEAESGIHANLSSAFEGDVQANNRFAGRKERNVVNAV